VDTEADIVVGTGTAPIEHAAGKHPTIHSTLQVKRRSQRSRAWILITKLGTLTRTARARPFVSCASAVLCPCVHFGNQAVRLTNRRLLRSVSCFLAMYYFHTYSACSTMQLSIITMRDPGSAFAGHNLRNLNVLNVNIESLVQLPLCSQNHVEHLSDICLAILWHILSRRLPYFRHRQQYLLLRWRLCVKGKA
jgi:hypothetical protein